MLRRGSIAAAAAVLLAFGLSGCAAGDAYSQQTASSLQHAVLDVATAASGNNLTDAQTKLAALQTLNDTAARQGKISASRHAAIATSIAAIRADLAQLQDQAEKARLQAQLQQLQQQQQQQQQDGKGHDKSDKHGDEGGDGG